MRYTVSGQFLGTLLLFSFNEHNIRFPEILTHWESYRHCPPSQTQFRYSLYLLRCEMSDELINLPLQCT